MTTPTERPILLVSGGPSTFALWPGLAERYDLVFLYPQAAERAQALGLPAIALAQLADGDLQEHIQNSAVLLSARVVAGLPRVAQTFAAAFGPQAAPHFNGHLGEWFPGYALHLLGAEIAVLAQLQRLAETGRRLAGCLTHEDVATDTRALVAWCRARGLPTLHVPHAPCHLTTPGPDIHKQTRAEWVLASGPAVADFYAENGHDPARIVVTGGPQWDELYGGALPARDEARAVLLPPDLPIPVTGTGPGEIGPDRPVVAYMTTWGQTTSLRSDFDREFEAGWQAVLAEARARGAYLAVLRHWNDQRPGVDEHYARALAQAGVDGLVTRDHKTYVLRAADVLVAQGPSNMCLEAAILGTPACYLQTEGFDYRTALPYRATPETLGAALTAALASRGAPEWETMAAAYNAAHPDGGAVDRVLEEVARRCP